MKSKGKILRYIVINIVILITIYLIYLRNIRICLLYNIFKIPCAGCGLTRAILLLLKGDIINSFTYNLLAIPLIILYSIYGIWHIKDLMKNEKSLNEFLEKNKKKIIIVCIIIFILNTIKNINNPLLY